MQWKVNKTFSPQITEKIAEKEVLRDVSPFLKHFRSIGLFMSMHKIYSFACDCCNCGNRQSNGCVSAVSLYSPPSSWQPILSGRHFHPLTFELRQRWKLNWCAQSAVLGRALGFSLFLGLPHGLSGKPVHFLGCGDGRHFNAQTAEDFRSFILRSNGRFPLLFEYEASCSAWSSSPVQVCCYSVLSDMVVQF